MAMNPMMNIIAQIRRGQNPQQIVMQLLESRMAQTPMGQNLLSLAQSGRTGDIEQIVRNLAQQQGIDFDKEFSDFRSMLGV